MRRMMIWLGGVVLLAAPCLCARDIVPKEGWVTGDHAEEAVAYAKKKGRAIVFLYAFSSSTCPLHNSRTDTYMNDRALGGMVKVLVYCDKPAPAAFSTVSRQVENTGPYVPRMYIADAELRILGFVRNEVSGTKLSGIASLAKGNVTWQEKTAKAIQQADQLADEGKFSAALKIYEKAREQDRKYAVLIARTWDEGASLKDAEAVFFPDVQEKMDGLVRKAKTRLDRATELFESQQYAEAKKLLEPMGKDKADLEPVKQAAELLAKVKEALKKEP